MSRVFLVNISTFQGMPLGILDADNSSVFFPSEVFSHVIGNATKGKQAMSEHFSTCARSAPITDYNLASW